MNKNCTSLRRSTVNEEGARCRRRINRADGWPEIDTSVAHVGAGLRLPAGGRANFAVDREAGRAGLRRLAGRAGRGTRRCPGRTAPSSAGSCATWSAEAGVRQFLDIGTGIPKEDNIHEVAQRVAPDARIVYADYDPIVLAHAHKLLKSTPEGACAYIYGDLRDPEAILRKAADTLDFDRPAAVVLFGILHFFADADEPAAIVARLMDGLAPGSYLAHLPPGRATCTARRSPRRSTVSTSR